MGWISNRRMNTGTGIGGYSKSSPKHGAPLRKIVERKSIAANMFEQDRVVLECGHETYSNGVYRARCVACKEIAM